MIKMNSMTGCLLVAILIFTANSCLKKDIEARPSGSIRITLKLDGEPADNRVNLLVSSTKTGIFEVEKQGICWSESPNPTIDNNELSSNTADLSYSQVLGGLNPGKQYYVRAYINGGNESKTTYSNEVTFNTQTASSLSIVTSPVSAISKTGAESGASLSITGAVTIKSKGLCWSTATLPTIGNDKTAAGEGAASFANKLVNLSPATRYYLRAYATPGQGETIYGNEIVFTTLSPFSMVVVTGDVSEITETGARVAGSVTGSGEGSVKESGVCWSTQENPVVTGQKKAAGSTGSFSISLDNLTDGTTYYLRAYGISSDNEVGYGKQASFKTSAKATYVLELFEYDNEPSKMRILREIRWGEEITFPNLLAQHFRLKKDGKYVTPIFMDNSFNGAASTKDLYLHDFKIYMQGLNFEFPIRLTLSNEAFRKIVNKVFRIPVPQSDAYYKISFSEQGQCTWASVPVDYRGIQTAPFNIVDWPYDNSYEYCASGDVIKKPLDGFFILPLFDNRLPTTGYGGQGLHVFKDGTFGLMGDVCTNNYPVKEME